jgi:hypothetical protein
MSTPGIFKIFSLRFQLEFCMSGARIFSALVARHDTVLAEFTASGVTGNFATVTTMVLRNLPSSDTRNSYVQEK